MQSVVLVREGSPETTIITIITDSSFETALESKIKKAV